MSRFRPQFRLRRGSFFLVWRLALTLAVVGIFAFSMSRLYVRERGERVAVRKLGISPDLLTVTWFDYSQYMWVERNGERVGAYVRKVEYIKPERRYEMVSRMKIDFAVAGRSVPVWLDTYADMNDRFELTTLQAEIAVAGQKLEAEAFVEGDTLYYRFAGPPILIEGGEQGAAMKLDEPVIMVDAIRPVVTRSDKLYVGKSWTTLASDPLSGRFEVPVRVEVEGIDPVEYEGETREAFRVSETVGGTAATAGENVTTLTWYDSEGYPLRMENKQTGLVMLQTKPENLATGYPELLVDEQFDEIDREKVKRLAEKAGPHEEGRGVMPSFLPTF